MEAANVVLIGFIVAFILGSFLVYKLYMYVTVIKNDGREKNYYYNRFMRNKAQVEKYIEVLQHAITIHNCGNEIVDSSSGMTVQQHLSKLKIDYEDDYTEVTQKILKKNRLQRKHKKTYIRLLSNQSEKLYNIENILATINQKYKN